MNAAVNKDDNHDSSRLPSCSSHGSYLFAYLRLQVRVTSVIEIVPEPSLTKWPLIIRILLEIPPSHLTSESHYSLINELGGGFCLIITSVREWNILNWKYRATATEYWATPVQTNLKFSYLYKDPCMYISNEEIHFSSIYLIRCRNWPYHPQYKK